MGQFQKETGGGVGEALPGVKKVRKNILRPPGAGVKGGRGEEKKGVKRKSIYSPPVPVTGKLSSVTSNSES